MAVEPPNSAEALIEQGELKSALKLLERARREAAAGGDVASLEQVLAGARLVLTRAEGKRQDEAGRIASATQQNIRFIGRKAALAAGHEWVDPFLAADPSIAAGSPDGEKRWKPLSVFGDPARPRSLAFGLIACLASFPVIWGLVFVAAAMSSGPFGDASTFQAIMILAAPLPSLGLVIATGEWVLSRRKVPISDRKPLASLEGTISAAGITAATGGTAVLAYVLWNLRLS